MDGCESWTIKKAEHLKTDAFELVLDKTLESPLDSKEIKTVNPKVHLPWIFIGNTVTKTEALIFGRMIWRANSLEKTLIVEKDWGQKRVMGEEKGMEEDKMVV